MAYTAPGTAVAGDVLTAVFWNAQVRDNMEAVAGAPFARNILYNGAMQVAQRGTSVASASGYATVDRWNLATGSLGIWTMSLENDAPTGSGLRKSAKVLCTTADASPAAGDTLIFQQRFEGQDLQRIRKGTSSALDMTLSFWVKSNVTGTYVVEFEDVDNTRSVSKSYTVSASATWEYKTISIPADITGAFDNDNAFSLAVDFWLGAGSTYTSGTLQTAWGTQVSANRAVGQTNLASAINNYWQVTGVQLETGSVATGFEFLPFGEDLRRCQRYYFRNAPNRTAYPVFARGQASATNAASVGVKFPVSMRTNPTTLETSGTASHYTLLSSTLGLVACTALAIGTSGETTTEEGWIVSTVASGLVAGNATSLHGNNTASAYIGFSAEL
jgi:hypothetical protein